MAIASAATGHPPLRRRDQQKEETRLDLAIAAFELARAEGLANVRVPQIAEAAGVSPRTFNNYFPSKEAAIVWPTTLRAARLASDLAERPADEPLADALEPLVLAAVVVAAERAAVLHWFRQAGPRAPLVEVVRAAVGLAVRGTGPGATGS